MRTVFKTRTGAARHKMMLLNVGNNNKKVNCRLNASTILLRFIQEAVGMPPLNSVHSYHVSRRRNNFIDFRFHHGFLFSFSLLDSSQVVHNLRLLLDVGRYKIYIKIFENFQGKQRVFFFYSAKPKL